MVNEESTYDANHTDSSRVRRQLITHMQEALDEPIPVVDHHAKMLLIGKLQCAVRMEITV
jgi:hypothetical protein